jgi:uncharacterized protein (TIGR00369 family)
MNEHTHDKLQQHEPTFRPGLALVRDGIWAGWYHWEPVDDFEEHAGPFYCQPDGDSVVCAFMPEAKNRNGGGNIHGGALMTFADYALFMISGGMETSVHGVTMTMNCDFVGAAEPGRMLTARGDVVRAGGSVVFVRGIIDDAGRNILAFSGTIKRFRRD